MGGRKPRGGKRSTAADISGGVVGANPDGGDWVRGRSAGGTHYTLQLVAPPAFWTALADKECPADVSHEGEGPVPEEFTLSLDNSAVADLLNWFAVGLAAAPASKLVFPPTLSKEGRAAIHTLVSNQFASGLEASSEGVAEARAISVFKKGEAPKRPFSSLSTEDTEKVNRLHKIAKAAGMVQLSRDEISEQVAGNALSAELQSLWESKSKTHYIVKRLIAAASAGDVGTIKDICSEHPELVRSNLADMDSGELPLHVAIKAGHVDAARALVEAGAGINDKDGRGKTALQVSRTFERCDAEALLLQLGAHDPDADKFPLGRAASDLASKGLAAAQQSIAAATAAAAASSPGKNKASRSARSEPLGQQRPGSLAALASAALPPVPADKSKLSVNAPVWQPSPALAASLGLPTPAVPKAEDGLKPASQHAAASTSAVASDYGALGSKGTTDGAEEQLLLPPLECLSSSSPPLAAPACHQAAGSPPADQGTKKPFSYKEAATKAAVRATTDRDMADKTAAEKKAPSERAALKHLADKKDVAEKATARAATDKDATDEEAATKKGAADKVAKDSASKAALDQAAAERKTTEWSAADMAAKEVEQAAAEEDAKGAALREATRQAGDRKVADRTPAEHPSAGPDKATAESAASDGSAADRSAASQQVAADTGRKQPAGSVVPEQAAAQKQVPTEPGVANTAVAGKGAPRAAPDVPAAAPATAAKAAASVTRALVGSKAPAAKAAASDTASANGTTAADPVLPGKASTLGQGSPKAHTATQISGKGSEPVTVPATDQETATPASFAASAVAAVTDWAQSSKHLTIVGSAAGVIAIGLVASVLLLVGGKRRGSSALRR